MKTLLTSIIIFFFILLLPGFSYAQKSPSPSPTSIPTSSYELFYPIVAGKVAGDSLYSLKLFREWIVDKFVFSPIRKADYHLILSKKRLVETEYLLLEKNDIPNAKKSIERSIKEFEKALDITNKATDRGNPTQDMYNALYGEGTKEKDFLKTIARENKNIIEAVSSFESLLEIVNSKRN